ncbi:uncharacterized protein MELLADRAFT_71833 [Melampsora larici-populina 98AG31]|uniref:Uncharacterized protein n=1 Tax=Melampsora larici-populina (strain 98AG31 / pathotype 3-4-7) TaxID=747676 RepID=F4RKW1_MELLP|nr:uncharacterized protein MELLADRAFT_71833 [Melampsora larici-populina 98AG31]EGG06968.1 hypothetical protein MELLADRAFT_71833 [Melampsora larici-populina 98AG31]
MNNEVFRKSKFEKIMRRRLNLSKPTSSSIKMNDMKFDEKVTMIKKMRNRIKEAKDMI